MKSIDCMKNIKEIFRKDNLKNIAYIFAGLTALYVLFAVETKEPNPLNWKNKFKEDYHKFMQEKKITKENEEKRKFVIDYIDYNKDGKISNKEKSCLDFFMQTEDSLTTYIPTQENWNKAYQNIQEIKKSDSIIMKSVHDYLKNINNNLN